MLEFEKKSSIAPNLGQDKSDWDGRYNTSLLYWDTKINLKKKERMKTVTQLEKQWTWYTKYEIWSNKYVTVTTQKPMKK